MIEVNPYKPWRLLANWMDPLDATRWETKIKTKLLWQQPSVRVFGKDYLVPRKTVFLGDEGISYSYSGTKHIANGWPTWFYPLLNKIRDESQVNFNGCLVNLYRDGRDKMGWHADDENEIDSNKSIFSLSLGTSRDFCLKHRHLNLKYIYTLGHGDLFIMYPGCQEGWLHSLPVRKKIFRSRINLTFRYYLS